MQTCGTFNAPPPMSLSAHKMSRSALVTPIRVRRVNPGRVSLAAQCAGAFAEDEHEAVDVAGFEEGGVVVEVDAVAAIGTNGEGSRGAVGLCS